ncbi:phosphoglycerate mutase-like protein [Hygrophoropsis aurantiaca]|uniref:Phosphoglycerate mutase-like protein n=1 Tax=Hygrophoropsis aurantiaca TaxID=72124 RepID=A0ACB8AEM9_9AGAM|nr:phosphoglycerate mutase-like protein [Hygrophoropsis aurantiaca]
MLFKISRAALSVFAALAYSMPSLGSVDVLDRLGNLSPYHKAPPFENILSNLPADCSVDQVILMQRHGSRWPLANELVFIQNLALKLGKAVDVLRKADLPPSLQFLKHGYETELGHDNLTAPGRKELFTHGVDFLLKYPHLHTNNILAGDQDRVIESAQWFALGYFGRYPHVNFTTMPEDSRTVSWITPMDTCVRWDYNYGNNATVIWGKTYLPPITRRLNKLLAGVGLTDDDTHGALYACAYDFAASGVSPWCDVFTPQELQAFEYELDLLMDGAFGYGLPGNMGPVLGSLYVNQLIDRFKNSTGDADALYLEFGHDTTIDLVLTALGLARDEKPLPPTGPIDPNRKWRTSSQVPFAAKLIWERFTCSKSFNGPQIRLLLNDATYPLSICGKTQRDRSYGICSLDAFVDANKFSTSIRWGDATWNKTCGPAILGTIDRL